MQRLYATGIRLFVHVGHCHDTVSSCRKASRRETFQRLVPFDDFGVRTDLKNDHECQRWRTLARKRVNAKHLLRIKPEDLQTFHSRSARQRDITLTLLKHLTKIDLDAL